MTPKEKAIELIDNYYILLDGFVAFEQVKKCSLIAVDEILSFIEDDRNGFNWKDFYTEVKQEIEAL